MLVARSMDRRQLLAIGFCFCLIRLEATITLGVMPVYAVQLGADPAATGLFMAFNFLGVTVGNIVGGWLADRSGQPRRFAVISSLLWIPLALSMTQATTVTGLILTSGMMWLPGGVAIATLYSILGLSAGEQERGRVFGWVALAGGLGALIAGLVGGPIAEGWSFPVLFIMMALGAGALLVITSVLIHDVAMPSETGTQTPRRPDAATVIQVGLSSVVYLLLLSRFFAGLGPTVSNLGRPLAMLQLNMNTNDVSSAIAFSAAITLPLPLILGWLSDRVGRKRLLILFYGFGIMGTLVLIAASTAWHFWLSAALVSLVDTSNGIGQAYIADLSDSNTIGRSLSLFTSSNFIANMIGLGGAGYVMQSIGINPTLLLGAMSLLIAIGLLAAIRPGRSQLPKHLMGAAA